MIQQDLPWCTQVWRLLLSSILQLIQSQLSSTGGENHCCSSVLSELNMFLWFSFLLSVIGLSPVSSHSVHSGQCPELTPMAGFDWDQVRLTM